MHPIDRAASWLFRFGPSSLKVFREGWGDEGLIASLDTSAELEATPELDIDWGDQSTEAGLAIRDGSFLSPAPHLPELSRLAHIRMVLPTEADGRLVVMMAAWNDHGYATRTGLAALLVERGLTAVMLENPFYGSRRPRPDQPIRTVADFAVMGRAAVLEGRALLKHFAPDHTAFQYIRFIHGSEVPSSCTGEGEGVVRNPPDLVLGVNLGIGAAA